MLACVTKLSHHPKPAKAGRLGVYFLQVARLFKLSDKHLVVAWNYFFSSFFINIVIRSMGKGKIRVLFLSEAISVSVCR